LLFSSSLTAQQKLPAGYAGSDACLACHDDLGKAFNRNPHHLVETGKSKANWKGMACESCHGPGAKHAESTTAADIINPAKQTAAKTNQNCMQCHLNQPIHAGWLRSGHNKNQVSCTSCHAVHKGQEALRPAKFMEINKLCASCHTSVWAQFAKPYKHRLDVGAMSCTDCHNPHGTFLPSSIRTVAANERSCYKCHPDKTAPFPFPHAPVRLEGCQTCHEPHGSANPRMLTRAEVRFVCLECHSNVTAGQTIGGVPPAFHDLRSPRFRNCTICHTKIHGSYVDPGLER
jgi:DmsE family decaheme c-type cytochrome